MQKILLLHGPNLNMLGQRDIVQYGKITLAEIIEKTTAEAAQLNYQLEAKQSNYEGQLIDWLQEAKATYAGVILNAGALTHYSYALLDAIADFTKPVIEVHISNIYQREKFRAQSVIRGACAGQITGFGEMSYIFALRQLVDIIAGKRKPVAEGRTDDEYQK